MATDNTSATFELKLEDGTSGPAEDAASALKQLRGQIDADTKALADMQRAMKNLQGGTSVNIAQFRALKEQIAQKKSAIGQAQSAYIGLGGTFGKTASSGGSVRSMFEQLTAQAKAVPGPIGGVVGKLESLKGLVAGGAIALGIVAITAALAALVVGTVAAIGALASYAVGQGDARRNELLRLEGLTKIRSIYGFTAAKASDLQASIDQVSGSSALGREQLSKYTEQLHRMGLRGQNLTDALEGMAITASTQGEAQASLFASMAAGASMAGQSVRKLSEDVKARLGGIAARQMLSLSVQTAKMREHFAVLFRDIKVEGFLKALQTITSLFSQSTASGRALKMLAETLLQPLIDGFEFLAPLAKRFFQGVILGLQAVAIQVLKVALWFKQTFGAGDILKGIDLTSVALMAGKVAASLLVAGFVAVGAILTVLAIPFALFAAQVLYVAHRISQFYGLVKDAFAFDWAALGTSITSGIVAGLKRGASWVMDAVKNLGKNAYKAFKAALGIASPSKEFAKLGVEIPRGIQQGINAGAPSAQSSVGSMLSVPDAPSGKGGSPRTITVNVGDIHVHSSGGDANSLGQSLKAELERIFEGVAMQLAAPTPGAS